MARKRIRNRSDAYDDIYNARRRYVRQAKRYENEATKASTPIEAGRLRKLGARALEKAINTYQDPKKANLSKPIMELQKTLSVEKPLRNPSESYRNTLIEESKSANVKGMSESERKESESSAILTGQVGRRVFGALEDVWKDKEDREQAILDYFGADSMMDVIEAIEGAGIDIYADLESEQKYDEVRTAIELAFKR